MPPPSGRGFGLSPHGGQPDGFGHRMCFSWAAIVLRGGLHLGSIYLRDSEGVSEANLLLIQEVAVQLKLLRGPWVLGVAGT